MHGTKLKSKHKYHEAILDQKQYNIPQSSMVGKQLDLARQIKQNMDIFGDSSQQPVQILFQILHAIQQAAIRAQLVSLHCMLQAYKLINVHIKLSLISRIQVDNHSCPLYLRIKFLHPPAISCLSTTRRSDNQLSIHFFKKWHIESLLKLF